MKLIVNIPATFFAERYYIITAVLDEILGIDFAINFSEEKRVKIATNDGRALLMPDVLFGISKKEWLGPLSLPKEPLSKWDAREYGFDCELISRSLPVIYGNLDSYYKSLSHKPSCILAIPIDIFGSIFFMLTRYEELFDPMRDSAARFPASASLAFREGFLHRPIVNEYIELLWACMSRLWPGLERRRREFRVFLTHDVDDPFSNLNIRWNVVAKACIGDMIKRRSPGLCVRRLLVSLAGITHSQFQDPYDTFEFIMNQSEQLGLRSAFYFISSAQTEGLRRFYDIEDARITSLIKKIHERGHEIGWHPGFGTFNNVERAREEFGKLKDVCARIAKDICLEGGRQHKLQWSNPDTWRIWESLAMKYDSSVAFAETPGFRSGTCYEHPVFDVKKRVKLKLRERPLIVMDTTYTGYLKYDTEKMYQSIGEFVMLCKKYRGDFVGLWHNNRLVTAAQKKWYENMTRTMLYS